MKVVGGGRSEILLFVVVPAPPSSCRLRQGQWRRLREGGRGKVKGETNFTRTGEEAETKGGNRGVGVDVKKLMLKTTMPITAAKVVIPLQIKTMGLSGRRRTIETTEKTVARTVRGRFHCLYIPLLPRSVFILHPMSSMS